MLKFARNFQQSVAIASSVSCPGVQVFNAAKWRKMLQHGAKCKMVHTGGVNGAKWWKMLQNGVKWCKIMQNGARFE